MSNVTNAFLEAKYQQALVGGDSAAIQDARDDLMAFLQQCLAAAQQELAGLRVLVVDTGIKPGLHSDRFYQAKQRSPLRLLINPEKTP